MTVENLGMEPLAVGRPTAQRRHVGLRPSLVYKDEAGRIKPALILLPLLAPPCDLRPELLGGQHAFFEAQPLGMNKAPDLNVIDLHPRSASSATNPHSVKSVAALSKSQSRLAPVRIPAL